MQVQEYFAWREGATVVGLPAEPANADSLLSLTAALHAVSQVSWSVLLGCLAYMQRTDFLMCLPQYAAFLCLPACHSGHICAIILQLPVSAIIQLGNHLTAKSIHVHLFTTQNMHTPLAQMPIASDSNRLV